ncbi:MAG TPA: class F sortase [Candidatus Saccharimonadales bacterium]|nr:class F sortase [Candidatus Saccharimonadales bacterium]
MLQIVVFAVSSLLLLFHLNLGITQKSALQSATPQSQVVTNVAAKLPVRLLIPAINVSANIQQVGVTAEGAMDVPSNTVDVGWFKLGVHPGERGSAVIAGHFDGENGATAVFSDLYKLKEGDKLYIEDAKGKTITFVVRTSRIYDPGYADEVFSANDIAHLNLITCDGVWEGSKKSYSKRLVVFSDIVH